ncbi:MAG TPA: TonB-dependent receptor [bacterium]|nr:TonB-dependent receptor [bacterium]
MNKGILSNLAVIFFLFVSLSGFSDPSTDSGSISGTVTQAETQTPLVGTNVLLIGTMLGAATDSQGRFYIPGVPQGIYEIKASAIGFKSIQKTVRVEKGQNHTVDFTLQETAVLMDGVSVTASRYQQSLDEIPVSVSLIPAMEIHERNILSVDEALKYVPGVNSMSGGQITIRGSSGFNWGVGSRVLVMVNGQPFMTGDNWSVNWYGIPTANINQVEVMKGSGSALYGSSAMGGVINIITQEPEEGNRFEISTLTGFYSKPGFSEWHWTDKRQHFEGTSVQWSTRLGKISTQLASSYRVTTGYRENDDNQIFNLMTMLGCNYNSNLRLDLMAGHARNQGGFYIYWKDLANPYANGSDPYGFRSRSKSNMTYVYPSVSYIINHRMLLTLKGRYAQSNTEETLKSKISLPSQVDPILDNSFRMSSVNSLGGEALFNYQISSVGTLVAGSEYQSDHVNSIQYGDRRISRASYYAQVSHDVLNTFKITLGGRYDGENIRSQGTSGEFSGTLGLNCDLSAKTHLRASMGQGFRAPAIAERFVSTFTGGLRVRENPGLLPERSLSAEAGIRQGIASSMTLDLSVFYSLYDNLIEPQLSTDPEDDAVVVRFENVNKALITGLDASLRTDWWTNQISSRVGYTFLNTLDRSPGPDYNKPLKYRSRHTLYVSTDFKLHPLSMGIDFRYLSQTERVDEYHKAFIKDIDARVPTYVASLRFGISPWRRYRLQLVIDNLFRYNYLIAPANMGPPLNATLQLKINS